MELNIPFLLAQYNNAKIGGIWRLVNLDSVVKDKGPAACLGCGSSTFHCPQNFDIPRYLGELSDMMAQL